MYHPHQNFKLSGQRRAGIAYENLVADTLKQEGWDVIRGDAYSEHDHGIDFIASKDGVRRYVQCKGYKSSRFIHEDVVSHLLGSVAAIEGLDNLQGVELYLYSPAQLDSYATTEANKLGIHHERLFFPIHQRIKHHFYRRHRY